MQWNHFFFFFFFFLKTIHIRIGLRKNYFTQLQNEYRQYNWTTLVFTYPLIKLGVLKCLWLWQWRDKTWLMTRYVLQMIYKLGRVWCKKKCSHTFLNIRQIIFLPFLWNFLNFIDFWLVDSDEQPIRSLQNSKKFGQNMILVSRIFWKYLTFKHVIFFSHQTPM